MEQLLTVLRNAISLMVILLFASCATRASLKIDEIRECLVVGADVEFVTSCIKPSFGYRVRFLEGRTRSARWPGEQCGPNTVWSGKACSHPDLYERLDIGFREMFDPATGIKSGEYEVIENPSLLVASNSGNLGGQFVQLYIFYNGSDNKVIGWIDMGSAYTEFDFRVAQ